MAGYDGVYRTSDGGASWDKVSVIDHGLDNRLFFIDDSIGFVSDGTAILKTIDQGWTWSSFQKFDNKIESIYFVDIELGFIGSSGKVYRTENSGSDWHEIGLAPGQPVLSIDFISENVGLIISSETCPCIPEKGDFYTAISKTMDGGMTWASYVLPGTLYSVDLLSERNGYVSGAENLIMRYSGGALDSLPTGYPWKVLGMEDKVTINDIKVFPNPVTDRLIIGSPILDGPLEIKIFSLDGKKIEVHQTELRYRQIEIGTGSLPKGTYLLDLTGPGYQRKIKFFKQ